LTSLKGLELRVNDSRTIKITHPRQAADIFLGNTGGFDFESKDRKREFVEELCEYLIVCAEQGLNSPPEVEEKYNTLKVAHGELQDRHLKVMQQLDNWVRNEAQMFEPVTGLYNNAYLENALMQNVSAAHRYKRDLSFVLFKVRDYDMLTRMFSGEICDKIAVTMADTIRKYTRTSDICARRDPNQYAIVLTNTGHQGAQTAAVRIQSSFNKVMREVDYINHGVVASSSIVKLIPDESVDKFVQRALNCKI